jgi:hypothetical protein
MGIGWSLQKNDGWRGQMARIRRWHERVIQAANSGSLDLEDFVFLFFQNCYLLREWLLKTSNVDHKDIEALFASMPQLRVCRDICNGTKHLTLNNPSVDPDFSIGREYDPSSPSGHRLFIIAHGTKDWAANGKYDLLQLSSDCVDAWAAFIAKQNVT